MTSDKTEKTKFTMTATLRCKSCVVRIVELSLGGTVDAVAERLAATLRNIGYRWLFRYVSLNDNKLTQDTVES